jgi:dihydrofolate synthase/folylpolyglutamate synthase
LPCAGRTHAVVAMLADKDVAGVAGALADTVHIWHVAGLAVERGAGAEHMAAQVRAAVGGGAVHGYATVDEALAGAAAAAGPADRIVVFGSFYTVAAALEPRNSVWWRQTGGADNARLSVG